MRRDRWEGWKCEEAGWWTKELVGGVCREADGRWSANLITGTLAHNFETMTEAMEYLERIVTPEEHDHE